jgi:hypothetical protein
VVRRALGITYAAPFDNCCTTVCREAIRDRLLCIKLATTLFKRVLTVAHKGYRSITKVETSRERARSRYKEQSSVHKDTIIHGECIRH